MNLDRLCDNQTLLTVAPFVAEDGEGFEVVAVVAKMTWRVAVNGECRVAVPQRPPRPMSKMLHEGRSSLLYASDFVDEKPGTDVLMLASVHPPADEQVSQQDVSLRIETGDHTIQKVVRAFGARTFMKGVRGITAGPAEPLQRMPLIYELAYGGSEFPAGGRYLVEKSNPVGLGVTADPERLIDKPAYQLEVVGGEAPAGFGPIAPDWAPRSDFQGTHDSDWQRNRAPLRPKDFNARHNCVAHSDLWSEVPLVGDEPVEIIGATPEGTWRFKLPRYAPTFTATVAGDTQPIETHLDTFLIDLTNCDYRVVEVSWRASVRLPRKTEQLESIVIDETQQLSKELYDMMIVDLESYRMQQRHVSDVEVTPGDNSSMQGSAP